MYAGFYFGTKSATWLGTHQKFNRAAYRALKKHFNQHLSQVEAGKEFFQFPRLKEIQHFEGNLGPDSLKAKAPGQDEPWHFIDPFNEEDTEIFKHINGHIDQLALAFKQKNAEKAAFEASWLAHVIVDGLTPAHHYPYEQELESIRGEGKETRNSKTKKMFIKGGSLRDTLWRNWLVVGARGVMTTHLMFEFNVTASLITHRIKSSQPSDIELEAMYAHGFEHVYRLYAQQIARFNMYGSFLDHGWSRKLSRQVRYDLAPTITKAITMSWLIAINESKK